MVENKYYEINEDAAKRALSMWSMSDYVMGSETNNYRKYVDEAYKFCEDVPENKREKAYFYADLYAKKLAENINKGFSIEMQCPSVLICGAGNFPTKKKEKQNAARDRNHEEYKRIEGYLVKIKNIVNGSETIKSGDENAVEALQEKLTKLEERQDYMKKANAYYRKNQTMVGYADLTGKNAKLFDEAIERSLDKKPFASCELTNNNAKIKNTKARLAQTEKVKNLPIEAIETEHFTIVRNPEIMRLQLIFEGKPSAEVRDILKSNGFKWSPKNGAWQRVLTDNAMYALKKVRAALAEME